MLKVFQKMKNVPFSDLKAIYSQSLSESARQEYGHRHDGLLQAENDFYDYLRSVFFQTEGAMLCLWYVDDKPVSALRLEPYHDGMLLTGLETDPQNRGLGYASMLVAAAMDFVCANTTVYAHIDCANRSSIRVHKKCGFEKITNFSVFLDGSVSNKAHTYARKFVNN